MKIEWGLAQASPVNHRRPLETSNNICISSGRSRNSTPMFQSPPLSVVKPEKEADDDEHRLAINEVDFLSSHGRGKEKCSPSEDEDSISDLNVNIGLHLLTRSDDQSSVDDGVPWAAQDKKTQYPASSAEGGVGIDDRRKQEAKGNACTSYIQLQRPGKQLCYTFPTRKTKARLASYLTRTS